LTVSFAWIKHLSCGVENQADVKRPVDSTERPALPSRLHASGCFSFQLRRLLTKWAALARTHSRFRLTAWGGFQRFRRNLCSGGGRKPSQRAARTFSFFPSLFERDYRGATCSKPVARHAGGAGDQPGPRCRSRPRIHNREHCRASQTDELRPSGATAARATYDAHRDNKRLQQGQCAERSDDPQKHMKTKPS
jgi:hypothetical protein